MISTLSHSPAKKLIMKLESVLLSSCLPPVHLCALRLCLVAMLKAQRSPCWPHHAPAPPQPFAAQPDWAASPGHLSAVPGREGSLLSRHRCPRRFCQRLLQRKQSWEPKLGSLPGRSLSLARSLGVAAGCHGTWRSAPAAISGGKRVARPCHESGRSPGPALPRAFCVLLCEHGRHLPTPGAKQASHIVELYHQMAWVVITLKPPSSSGCSAPRRNSPRVPPEMRHPELWAAVPMPQRPLLYEEFPPNTCRLHPAELWVSPSLEASQPLWTASGSLQGKNKLGCFLCAEDKVPDGHFFVIYL